MLMQNPERYVVDAVAADEQAAAVAELVYVANQVGEAASEPVTLAFPEEVVEWFSPFVDTNIGTVQLEPGFQHMLNNRFGPEQEVRRYTLEEVSFRLPVAHVVADAIAGEHTDDEVEAMIRFQAIYPVAGMDDDHATLYAQKFGRIKISEPGHTTGASMQSFRRRLEQMQEEAGQGEPDFGDRIVDSLARVFRPKKYAKELREYRDRVRLEDRAWEHVTLDELQIVTEMLRIAGKID